MRLLFLPMMIIALLCAAAFGQVCELCGDVDGNGTVNISDAVAMIGSLVTGTPLDCEWDQEQPWPPDPTIDYRNADGYSLFGTWATTFFWGDPIQVIYYIFYGAPAPTEEDCRSTEMNLEVAPANQIQISCPFSDANHTYWNIGISNDMTIQGLLLTFDCDSRITTVDSLLFPETVFPDTGAACQAGVITEDSQLVVGWAPLDGSEIEPGYYGDFLMRIKVPLLSPPVKRLKLNTNAASRTSVFIGAPSGSPPKRPAVIPTESKTIPTLSEWALIIFTLLLLATLTYVFLKRQRAAAAA